MRYDTHSYRFADEVLNAKLKTKNEIEKVLKGVAFSSDSKELNKMLRKRFTELGWEKDPTVTPDLNLKADFRKNRVQIEVQFGNVARYYADILKFQVSFTKGLIDIGILVLPKKDMSREIGSNRAFFERAVREIEHLKTAITLPMLIIGLEK